MKTSGLQKRQISYAVVLAIAAVAILIVGYIFKPRSSHGRTQTAVENAAVLAEIESLRSLAQRNSLRNTSARFAAIASADTGFLMHADNQNATAVIWSSDDRAIVPTSQFPSSLPLKQNDVTITAGPVFWSADIPLSVYQAHSFPGSVPEVMHTHDFRPGMWVIADALGPQGPAFISGMYSGLGTTTCQGTDYPKILVNAPLDKALIGAGVFSIDNLLVAVVAQCDDEVAAIPIDAIADAFTNLKNSPDARFKSLGFTVQPIAPPLNSALKTSSGLVVTATWVRWPAQRAGILPGDVIAAINGESVTSVGEAAQKMEQLPVTLQITRSKRSTVSITLDPSGASEPVPIQAEARGVVVSDITGPLTRASGIRIGDRILQIDSRPATEPAALEALSKHAKSLDLIVQRGPKFFLVSVPQ